MTLKTFQQIIQVALDAHFAWGEVVGTGQTNGRYAAIVERAELARTELLAALKKAGLPLSGTP